MEPAGNRRLTSTSSPGAAALAGGVRQVAESLARDLARDGEETSGWLLEKRVRLRQAYGAPDEPVQP